MSPCFDLTADSAIDGWVGWRMTTWEMRGVKVKGGEEVDGER